MWWLLLLLSLVLLPSLVLTTGAEEIIYRGGFYSRATLAVAVDFFELVCFLISDFSTIG